MLTASCTPQGSQPGHAEASAACPSGAHPILSDLAGSSERDSRGAGSISELQCARHADCSVDGSQQQQHQVCQHHHQHEAWEEAQHQQQQQQQQRAGREEEQQQQRQQEQHEGREEEQQQQHGREEKQQQQQQHGREEEQQQQQQQQQEQHEGREEEQQQQQRQPDFDPEQEILSPLWQERMKKKRARLLNRLQCEAPQAAGLASEVSFRLVGKKRDDAVLRYVFREEYWPSTDKLFPVLEAAARASAGSTAATKGASDRPRPAACRQQEAGEQRRQQASFAAPSGAAPLEASRPAAGSAPGSTNAGASALKRGRPPSSDKDSRERKKKRVDDCRKRMRDHVEQHAPETIPLFERKVSIRYVGADPRPVFEDKTFLRKADLVAALKAALQHQGREAGTAAGGGAAGARPTAAQAGSRSGLAAASGLAANKVEAAAVADYQDLRAGELLEAFNQLPPECGGPDQPKNTHDKLWLWQRLLKARGIDSQRAKELARSMQERAASRGFETVERPKQRITSAKASMQHAARQPAASTPLPRAPGQAGTSAQRQAPTGWALVGPQQEEATAAAEAAHLRRLLREERKRRAAAERLTKELEAQLQAAQQGTAAEEQPPARAADDSADAEAEAGPSADEAAAKGVGLASILLLYAERTKARAARLQESSAAAAAAAAAAREVAEREAAQLAAQLLTANAAAAAAQEEAEATAQGVAALLRRAELAEQRAAVAAAAETAAKDEAARLLERLQEEVAGHAETRRQAAAEKAEAIKEMRQVHAAAAHQVKAAAEAAQAARAEREQAAQRQAAEAEHRLQLQQVQQEAAVQRARMEGHESGMTACSQLLQPLLQQVLGAMSAPNAQQTLAAVPGAHAAGAAAQQDQHAQRGQHLLQQVLAQFQREQGRRVWQPWSQQAAQQGQQAAQRAVPVGQPGPAGWQVPAAQP